MIEAGRIVARLCRVYGWTPDYCLDRLSWAQVLMYDAYAEETIQQPFCVPTAAPETARMPDDAPDVAAIEQMFAGKIKRGVARGR